MSDAPAAIYVKFTTGTDTLYIKKWRKSHFPGASRYLCSDTFEVETRHQIETRFWSIVNQYGLTDLPSDMWDALQVILSRYAGIPA